MTTTTPRPATDCPPSRSAGESLADTARRMFAERCERALAGGASLIGKYPLASDNDCTCPDAVRLRHVRQALKAQGINAPMACKHAIAADFSRRHRAGLTTSVPMPGGYSLVIRPKSRRGREEATR